MRLSRRSLLVGGGVAAAAVGVPAAQKLHWNGKNFVQEGYDPSLPVAPDGRAFVTLSRIRHRLLAGRENDVPGSFSVLIVDTVPPRAAGDA